MIYQAIHFALMSYMRRFAVHWPLWASAAAAVAMVLTGSVLPVFVEGTEQIRGLDSQKATTFLWACAVLVAAIQVTIIGFRTLLSDRRDLRAMFAMGVSMVAIIILRAVEMVLGSCIACLLGMCLGVFVVTKLFLLPFAQITVFAVVWAVCVGALPIVLVGVVPKLVRGSPQ